MATMSMHVAIGKRTFSALNTAMAIPSEITTLMALTIDGKLSTEDLEVALKAIRAKAEYIAQYCTARLCDLTTEV